MNRASLPPDRASLLPEEEMPFQIGDEIDGYRITGILGVGAMGIVYRALDIVDQEFAIKCVCTQAALSDEDVAIEARILSRLKDDHIVKIATARKLPRGFFMIVMELLVGEPLRARMARGRLSPLEAVRVGIGVARGLAYGHRIGITHRDIKPENIFLTEGGGVKIVDYGIAKLRRPGRASTIGKRYGTPKYAAPEQFSSTHPMGPWSDLYSLNVALYEGLTRRHPLAKGPGHEGLPASDGMGAAHALWVPPPMEAILPELTAYRDLQDVILRGLAKYPEERWWRKPRGLDLPEDRQDLITWDYVAALEAILPRLEAEEKRRTRPSVLDTEPMTKPPKGTPPPAGSAAPAAAVPAPASGPCGTELLVPAPAVDRQAQPILPTPPAPAAARPRLRTAPFPQPGETAPLEEPPSPRRVLPFMRPLPYDEELRTGDAEDDDAAAGWVRATRAMTREGRAIEKDGLTTALRLHPHPAVRAVCAEELTGLGDARCLPDLIAQLVKEKHPAVVRRIQDAIHAIEQRRDSHPPPVTARRSAGPPASVRPPPAAARAQAVPVPEPLQVASDPAAEAQGGRTGTKAGCTETRTGITDVTAADHARERSGEVPQAQGAALRSYTRSLLLGAFAGLPISVLVAAVVLRWPASEAGKGVEPAPSGTAATAAERAPSVAASSAGTLPAPVPSVSPATGASAATDVPAPPASASASSAPSVPPAKERAAAKPAPKPKAAVPSAVPAAPAATRTSVLPFGIDHD